MNPGHPCESMLGYNASIRNSKRLEGKSDSVILLSEIEANQKQKVFLPTAKVFAP